MVLNTSGFFFQLGRKLFWSALDLLSWAEEAEGGGWGLSKAYRGL